MSFEREFLTMMPHTIWHQRRTGVDLYNRPAYDPVGTHYRCRITGKSLALRERMGEQDTVIFDIYVCPFPVVNGVKAFAGVEEGRVNFKGDIAQIVVNDKITLPANQGWRDRTPELFAVGNITDETGLHHIKVQCGWMYHRQGQ